METTYAVRVHDTSDYDGHPRDAFFGYAPTLYRTRQEAENRVSELETSGDWGDYGPPAYYVQAIED